MKEKRGGEIEKKGGKERKIGKERRDGGNEEKRNRQGRRGGVRYEKERAQQREKNTWGSARVFKIHFIKGTKENVTSTYLFVLRVADHS